MSGLPYSNMRSVIQNMPLQYGVSQPLAGTGADESLSGMPLLGAGIGALGNIFSQYLQNKTQVEMYNAYMSPQARMAQMRAAGINPNVAAQGIAGASSPGMTAAAPTNAFNGIGEQIGNSVNTSLTAENIKANTSNIQSQTEGQNIENKFNIQTFEDRALYLKNQGLISEERYKQVQELTSKYPEFLTETLDQIRSNIRKNDAQVRLYDQQIDNFKEEIKKIQQEIKTLTEQASYYNAAAGEMNVKAELEMSQKKLVEKQDELAEIEKQKAALGADDNIGYQYRKIEKESGIKAADEWLEGQYNIVNKIQTGIQDANPLIVEQRRVIDSYDESIRKQEKYVRDLEDKYYSAGSLRKSWYSGELERARKTLDSFRNSKAEALRRLNINETSSTKVGPVSRFTSK